MLAAQTQNTISQIMTLFNTMPRDGQKELISNLTIVYQKASPRERFEELYEKWKYETWMYSNPSKFVNNPNFKAIVEMGESAVPFIIEKIKEFPSDLVKALNKIYNCRISPDKKVSISEACKLWIEKLGY
ncbi:MAG: hypothetical protein MJZ61_00225 [Bacteroidales bacterium]|nr:hypothetical protein [Bacteroidales bacterium]